MSPTTLEPPGPLHQTGEQPATFTEKSRFSWPVVLTIAGLSVSAVSGIAVASSTAKSADEKAVAAESCCKSATGDLHRHELRIQRVEDAQAATTKTLERIEKKLDEMLDARRGQR